MEEKKLKRKKILKVAGLIGLFLLVFGLSYALFRVTLSGTKKVKISTGKLELKLLDENNNPIYITDQNTTSSFAIELDNQVPVSDETGSNQEGFTFKLQNSGTISASYTIYLDDVELVEGEDRIADEYIRYSLTKNNTEGTAEDLTDIGSNPNRKLDTGVIARDDTNTYTLKVWIAEDATNEAMEKVFHTTLRVEGVQYVEQPVSYGTKIAETQLSENITATYYQDNSTSYNYGKVTRMSNVKKMDNEQKYEGGTLVISGAGEMPDETFDVQLFLAGVSTVDELEEIIGKEGFKYNPTNLVIEEGITKVGNYSFGFIASLINVSLPSTLKIIGEYAFFGASSLENLTLPVGLEEIDDWAFGANDSSDSNRLQEVRIPNTVTTIKNGAFCHCYYLKTLYIPSSVITIEDETFNIAANSTIYVESQSVADLLESGYSKYSTAGSGYNSVQLIVDQTKFE